MIRGYPARASVVPGELLALHVSTDAARFRVLFYRWWDGAELMLRSEWQSGCFAPARGADEDWHWPRYEFAIPLAWPSSVYIAYLEDEGGPPFDIALSSAAALFVVRGRGGADVLYKIPLATFHAYNYSGGGCFYANSPRSRSPPGTRLSLLRPGGGIGGETWGAPDYYDEGSARQTFAHWDAPFIRWLAGEGYRADSTRISIRTWACWRVDIACCSAWDTANTGARRRAITSRTLSAAGGMSLSSRRTCAGGASIMWMRGARSFVTRVDRTARSTIGGRSREQAGLRMRSPA